MRSRTLIILIALDHLVLALLTLGNCHRGQTLSASAWLQEQNGKLQGRIFRPFIDFIFRPVEADHCANSWLRERHMYHPPGAQP